MMMDAITIGGGLVIDWDLTSLLCTCMIQALSSGASCPPCTTGPPPPGERGGCSFCVGWFLYAFGGWDKSSYVNDTYKLDLIKHSSVPKFNPLVINLLKRVAVDLSAWMREICAALEDEVLVPHNQDLQNSPGTHDTLMDVDGQMSSISLM